MSDVNSPPPPTELSEEGTAKKPWSRPEIRVVMFNSDVEGTPRLRGVDNYSEHPSAPPAVSKYDPNIS